MQKLQGWVEQGNTTLSIGGAAGVIARKVQGSYPLATVTVYLSSAPAVAISSIARAANVVTVTVPSGSGFIAGELVTIASVTDASFNGTFTILTAGATTFTYAQVAANASSSSGTASSTLRLASIYSDDASSPTAKANPFTSGSDGSWFAYAPNGRYDIRFSGGGIATPFTIGDIAVGLGASGVPSYPFASLPVSKTQNAGNLARVTDTTRGFWMDSGIQWIERFGNIVNVKDYGARGDGVTNDTLTIQAAVDACAAAGGGIVHLPLGTYLLSTQQIEPIGPQGYNIFVKSNVWLRGSGRGGTVLKSGVADANIVFSSRTTDVAVSHLTTDGAGISNNADGVKMLGVTRYQIFDVDAYRGRGGFQSIGSTDGSIIGCYARDQVRDAGGDNAFAFSVGSDSRDPISQKISLVNCFAFTSQDHGFQLFQNVLTSSKDVSLANCHAWSNGAIGFRVSDCNPSLVNCRGRGNLVNFHIITNVGAQFTNCYGADSFQESWRLTGAQRNRIVGCTGVDSSKSLNNTYDQMLIEDSGVNGSTNNQIIGGTYGNLPVGVGGRYGIAYGTSPNSGLNQFLGIELYNNATGPFSGLKANDNYLAQSPDDLARIGGALTVGGPVSLFGDISPAALSGNVNDYAPANFSTASIVRITLGAANRDMTGLAGGSDGRVITICNIDPAGDLTLTDDDALSLAANRFYCPNNAHYTIRRNGSVQLTYDSTSNHWRVIAG